MAKLVRYNKVSLYLDSLFIYFTITGVKKTVRHKEDFVISRFYCTPVCVFILVF